MNGNDALDIEGLIDQSGRARDGLQRRRARLGVAVSASITIVWAFWVTIAGHWGRVGDHWASAVTMIFGSFVAGSTPQGGGAVAFPVFTKVLEVPSEVARTFSLTIQSVGMTAASAGILLNRRPIERRAIGLAVPVSIAGFLVGTWALANHDAPFAPSVVPGAYVKVTFTVIVAAMAFVTWLGYRNQLLERRDRLPTGNRRVIAALVVCSLLGGLASSLVGSGSDVFVYLALVSLVGLSPRVGVATSVLVMTAVSLVGLVVLSLGSGHLDVALATADVVASVDGRTVTLVNGAADFTAAGSDAPSGRYDLFGLWLAAAPVVAWGAPLGSAVSARATDRQVVKFVVTLAALEFVSTVVFLDELRRDGALIVFAVAFLTAAMGGLWWTNRHRHRLLALPTVDLDATVTRGAVDVGPNFDEQLGRQP